MRSAKTVGSPMAKKFGRFGEFLACINYPDARRLAILRRPTTRQVKKLTRKPPKRSATNCGRPMAMKRGRFGQFLACTGYPECKTTRKIQKGGKFAAPDGRA